MLFNSINFLVFFLAIVLLYFSLPYRYRWMLLLASSYYFYMCWKPAYVILIILSTLVDYIAGLGMGRTAIKSERMKYLLFSLVVNLGLLFAFKYFNFFNGSLKQVFSRCGLFYNVPDLKVLLPVGISFYTFQTLSYTIDVYRGVRKPEKHLGIFALYVAFFPQLVSGPIERSTRLLPQFFNKYDFDYKRVTDGIKLMLWGFFQKVVIADRLAIVVDKIYDDPASYRGIYLIAATYFFAFQIYCDFAGYTAIARGAARILGYDLMKNFRQPYFASSIREFWQRWHISLSTWFRDYFYIPLGGNRVTEWRWYCNIIVVFLVSGLWHGANWTFIAWGALHGIYFLFSIWTKTLRSRVAGALRLERFPAVRRGLGALVIFHLVLLSWVFFRARSITDALYIIRNFFNWTGGPAGDILKLGVSEWDVPIAISSILLLLCVQFIEERGDVISLLSRRPIYVRWAVYIFLVLSVMNLGVIDKVPFIYFQF